MPLFLEMVVPLPAMEAAVEGLTLINLVILDELQACPQPPPLLYQSAVRYRHPGKRRWHSIAELFDKLEGDCKDLAAARCAELRYYGEDPGAAPYVYKTRTAHRYHAVVRRGDGSIEDPSRILRLKERMELRGRRDR